MTARSALAVPPNPLNNPGLPNLGCETLQKSGDGGIDSIDLTIWNTDSPTRRIYWLDFDGAKQFMGNVERGQSSSWKTYHDHVWLIEDETNRCIVLYKIGTEKSEAILIPH